MKWLLAAAAFVTLVGAIAVPRNACSAAAPEVLSQRDIETALLGGPTTAPSAPRTRGIVIKAAGERNALTSAADDTQALPAPAHAAGGSVNLSIPFELGSAQLQSGALAQLEQLEAALRSGALGGARFRIAGHTDARGTASYNRELSRRRADAVRNYLVTHGVAARRLEAIGYGMDRPLLPDQPLDGANRRVEISNLGDSP